MKLSKSAESKLMRYLIIGSYILLIGLLIFSIFELPNKYFKEEMKMVIETERLIKDALDQDKDSDKTTKLDALIKKYQVDVVVTRGEEVVYASIPYQIGYTLLERTNAEAVVRESQGEYISETEKLFVWYNIYHLNDSLFINNFFLSVIVIVCLISILTFVTLYLMFKELFHPLQNIKVAIEHAQEFEFGLIEDNDDVINKEFKSFVTGLETDIDVVSRQHTQLEQQLQAKREHLNNLVVVSRSMIHDLKTPLHQSLIENEMTIEDHHNIPELVGLAQNNKEQIHEILIEINRILSMLKEDGEGYKQTIEEVEIVQLLIQSIKRFSTEIRSKELQVDYSAPNEIFIKTEESTFILLVNNLISNMVLYANEGSEVSIYVDQSESVTTLTFSNESTEENINRMKKTEQLFVAIKDAKNEGYIYQSGNGLYLIKDLSRILEAKYTMDVTDTTVTVEVQFHEH